MSACADTSQLRGRRAVLRCSNLYVSAQADIFRGCEFIRLLPRSTHGTLGGKPTVVLPVVAPVVPPAVVLPVVAPFVLPVVVAPVVVALVVVAPFVVAPVVVAPVVVAPVVVAPVVVAPFVVAPVVVAPVVVAPVVVAPVVVAPFVVAPFVVAPFVVVPVVVAPVVVAPVVVLGGAGLMTLLTLRTRPRKVLSPRLNLASSVTVAPLTKLPRRVKRGES